MQNHPLLSKYFNELEENSKLENVKIIETIINMDFYQIIWKASYFKIPLIWLL